jgi:Tol biopolymer transport system component
VTPADGGAIAQLTTGGNATGFDPTWSPDGNSLALGGFPGIDEKLVVSLLNLSTHRLSVLPGSEEMFAPRWSPDGRYIAALSADSATLLVFNLQSQSWTELAKATLEYPSWSSDSEYLYFDTYGADPAFFRVRIRDRRVERIVSLKDIPRVDRSFGSWIGLALDGSPLIQRDASFDEIYALDWEAP